jgi:hypothetical protein
MKEYVFFRCCVHIFFVLSEGCCRLVGCHNKIGEGQSVAVDGIINPISQYLQSHKMSWFVLHVRVPPTAPGKQHFRDYVPIRKPKKRKREDTHTRIAALREKVLGSVIQSPRTLSKRNWAGQHGCLVPGLNDIRVQGST